MASKRGLKRKKYRKTIPKIKKHCPICKTVTLFEYDRVIGHSHCTMCGYRNIPVLHKYKEKET